MQAYNALPYEESKFNEKVQHVFELAKKEAIASGIFFGSTGWSGNVTLLALLGYGEELLPSSRILIFTDHKFLKAALWSAQVQFRSETYQVYCCIRSMLGAVFRL